MIEAAASAERFPTEPRSEKIDSESISQRLTVNQFKVVMTDIQSCQETPSTSIYPFEAVASAHKP